MHRTRMHRTAPHRALAAWLALAILVIALPASAQDPEEPMKTAAKALYNEARQARKGEDFATCYAKATAAWAIHKHPSIAALAGDCGVGVGKYRDAAEKIQAWMNDPNKVGSPELQAHLESRLAEAKQHIASVELSVSVPEADCDVDGNRVERVPTTVFLDPGTHDFEARHPDHKTAKQQVTVTAGQTIQINLTLEVKVQAPPPPPPPPKKPERGVGLLVGAGVAGAVTLGGLAITVAAAVLHGSAQDDVASIGAELDAQGGNSACTNSDAGQCGDLASAIDDQNFHGSTLFPVGVIVMGVGAAATATFLVLHFVGGDDTEAGLYVTPTGMGVRGRF